MVKPSIRIVSIVGLLLLLISLTPVPVQSGKPVPCPQGGIGALSGLLNLLIPVVAGCPPTYWAKSYGNTFGANAYSVQPTSDGGFIVAGNSATPSGSAGDFRVLRLDSDGNVVWQKTYGGGNAEWAYSVRPTSDGGFIVAGQTYSFGAGSNDSDAWVLRLDANGNVIWQKTYSGGKSESANSVHPTSDGGFVVAGSTSSFGAGSSDVWVLRLDGNGNIVWQKTYGGINLDTTRSVQPTSDGGFVVAGYTSSFGAGSYDFWVLRLDANGNALWQKTYGGALQDYAYQIRQTSDGGFVVAGQTFSFGAGSTDVWVLRLDASGNAVWQKTYGGSNADIGSSVQSTSDGGFVVAGYTSSFGAGGYDVWILRLDGNGNVVWQKTYGGAFGDFGYSMEVTVDGGLVVAGRTDSFPRNNGGAWVLRLDANGSIPSNCSLGTTSTTVANDSGAITADSSVVSTDSAAIAISTTVTGADFNAKVSKQCVG